MTQVRVRAVPHRLFRYRVEKIIKDLPCVQEIRDQQFASYPARAGFPAGARCILILAALLKQAVCNPYQFGKGGGGIFTIHGIWFAPVGKKGAVRIKGQMAKNYNGAGRESVQVKDEDADWLIYHLIAQEPGDHCGWRSGQKRAGWGSRRRLAGPARPFLPH